MPKVKFKFDIEKDFWNYNRNYDKEISKEDLEKTYSVNKNFFDKQAKSIESKWLVIEKKFFERLAKITKRKIYSEEFTCYFTTIGKCPYRPKENWFMASIFNSLERVMTTIAHELFHLQFHHYFEDKIPKEKFQNIKEALTVLLNVEFKDILTKEDKGYEKNKDLREFIINNWDGDFDNLLRILVR